jgi:1-acyl-sn-glycerol-3-phosphate acyltransferase
MGWSSDNGPIPEKKAIVLGVPHTSAWDFVVSYLFYTQFGKTAHIMIKKEFFVWPVGSLLRKVGCIPVDRSNATALVRSIITEMEKDDEFHLAIAPEGTRKAIKRWKTGFHMIARAVDCPVYLGYFDWGTKHIGIGKRFDLTDDAKGDLAVIQAKYEEMHLKGKHPEGYITH